MIERGMPSAQPNWRSDLCCTVPIASARSPACPAAKGTAMSLLIRRRGEENWHEPITQSHTKEAELQKLLAHSLTPPAATGLVRPRRQGGSVVPQRAQIGRAHV